MGQWNTLLNCIPCIAICIFLFTKSSSNCIAFLCIVYSLFSTLYKDESINFKVSSPFLKERALFLTEISVFYHITCTGEIEFQKPTLSQRKMHIPLRSWWFKLLLFSCCKVELSTIWSWCGSSWSPKGPTKWKDRVFKLEWCNFLCKDSSKKWTGKGTISCKLKYWQTIKESSILFSFR